MIERETWILLAERHAEIALERLRREAELDDSVMLVFDSNDQASVVKK